MQCLHWSKIIELRASLYNSIGNKLHLNGNSLCRLCFCLAFTSCFLLKTLRDGHEYLNVFSGRRRRMWQSNIKCEGVNRPIYIGGHALERRGDRFDKSAWVKATTAIVFLPRRRKSDVSHRVPSMYASIVLWEDDKWSAKERTVVDWILTVCFH